MRTLSICSLSLITSLTLGACGEDEHHDHDHTPDAAETPDSAPTPDAGAQAVSLAFAGEIGGRPFACGSTYFEVGSASSAWVATDFRLYLSDIELIPAGGGDGVPLTLDVGDFQNADGIALLDFEDGSAGCEMGSTGTHTRITGTVPYGDYDGLRFTIGLPEDKNHLDVTTAAPPLNVTPMFWGWRAGYKFLKIDGGVGGNGFNLHLGATDCPGPDPVQPPTGPCGTPNRMEIELASFDPATDTVVIDPKPVYATTDVSFNTAATAPGCMSFPGDPECETLFPRLGLPYGAAPAADQQLISVR
ncbi:MAG: metallo-mystery pair system four-Cys motif protein [Kofleriaceae bacterium]